MFKVGQKVKIRSDLLVGKNYNGCCFVFGMLPLKGKICTICRVAFNSTNEARYLLLEDEMNYFWSKNMFLNNPHFIYL